MNKKLKKIIYYRRGRSMLQRLMGTVGILIGLFLILAYAAGAAGSQEKKAAVPFYPGETGEDEYCYLGAVYLSDSFASFTSNEDHVVCLAEDIMGYPYVICLDEAQLEANQELLAYTYGESDVNPGPVTFYGYPAEMDEELKELVAETGNVFWNTNFLTTGNVEEYFGPTFLDTTRTPYSGAAMAATGGIFILMSVALIVGTMVNERKRKLQRAKVLSDPRAEYDMEQIGAQLASGNASYYRKAYMYITDQYAVCGKEVFDYVNLKDCMEIRRETYQNGIQRKASLVLTDVGGAAHRMGVMNNTAANMKIHQDMIQKIRQRSEEAFYTGEQHINMLDMEGKASIGMVRRVLGIIGAVVGACLGGIVWIMLAELGFIAGISGLFMVVLAMSGYRLCAGGLDRKGAVHAIIIAFILVIPACLASNVIAVYQAFGYNGAGGVTIWHVVRNLGYYMSEYDQWGSFLLNLIIGLILSLAASWSVIKDVIKKN